jgi:hypothetical protein
MSLAYLLLVVHASTVSGEIHPCASERTNCAGVDIVRTVPAPLCHCAVTTSLQPEVGTVERSCWIPGVVSRWFGIVDPNVYGSVNAAERLCATDHFVTVTGRSRLRSSFLSAGFHRSRYRGYRYSTDDSALIQRLTPGSSVVGVGVQLGASAQEYYRLTRQVWSVYRALASIMPVPQRVSGYAWWSSAVKRGEFQLSSARGLRNFLLGE